MKPLLVFDDEPVVIDTSQAAKMLNLSSQTLIKWRKSPVPTGPRYYKYNRRVFYHLDDVQQYKKMCTGPGVAASEFF